MTATLVGDDLAAPFGATQTPGPPRVRMARHDRREFILDEAMRVIGAQGYRGFSINDLAKRCGLSTAGLLHYFTTKEGLLVALLEHRDQRDRDAIVEGLTLGADRTLSHAEALRVLRAIVVRNAEQPQLTRLYAVLRTEALMPDHPAHAYFRHREKATLARFEEIAACVGGDAGVIGMQIQAMMYGLQLQWLRDDGGFDLASAWDQVATKLLG